jgi:hypothetical protein
MEAVKSRSAKKVSNDTFDFSLWLKINSRKDEMGKVKLFML